jgi:hypothetical protein
MKLRLVIPFIVLLIISPAWGATHYASPTGSASWTASTNISTPCSLSTAWSNAVAGDLVYLRGGNYTITSQYLTSHAGTGDADAQRIIFRAYTRESPNIVSSSSEHVNIHVVHSYWTFDGINIHCATGKDDSACIGTYETSVTGLKILNAHIHMTSAVSYDNVDVIMIHNCTSCVVQKCNLEGYTTSQNGGVILFNGSGNKILNNEIHGGAMGIYQKHPNYDTSLASGAEWAYNYITVGSTGVSMAGAYINIHDNIAVAGGQAFRWGENAGGGGGHNGMVVNHNTFKGEVYIVVDWGLPGATIKNNIMTGGLECYGCTMGTWTYNLLGWTQSGGNNINGQPTFTGGSNPNTITGFALASGSLGKSNGDDGKDRGANVNLVGRNPSGGGDITPPVAPNNLIINF